MFKKPYENTYFSISAGWECGSGWLIPVNIINTIRLVVVAGQDDNTYERLLHRISKIYTNSMHNLLPVQKKICIYIYIYFCYKMATCCSTILYHTRQWLTWAREQFAFAAHDVKRRSTAEYRPRIRPLQLHTLATLPTWQQQAMVMNKFISTELSWNYREIGNIKYFFDTCPSATLCTTNPTQTGLGFNFCLCS